MTEWHVLNPGLAVALGSKSLVLASALNLDYVFSTPILMGNKVRGAKLEEYARSTHSERLSPTYPVLSTSAAPLHFRVWKVGCPTHRPAQILGQLTPLPPPPCRRHWEQKLFVLWLLSLVVVDVDLLNKSVIGDYHMKTVINSNITVQLPLSASYVTGKSNCLVFHGGAM